MRISKSVNTSKRRISTSLVPLVLVSEIDVPADAVVYGIEPVKDAILLVLGIPEGTSSVKRKIWMVPDGQTATVDAQQGDFLGVAVVESSPKGLTGPQGSVSFRRIHAVWLETEEQSLTRHQHRGGVRG